jgi:hypothetical protein
MSSSNPFKGILIGIMVYLIRVIQEGFNILAAIAADLIFLQFTYTDNHLVTTIPQLPDFMQFFSPGLTGNGIDDLFLYNTDGGIDRR